MNVSARSVMGAVQHALGTAKVATRVEGAKNVALGAVRGVGEGTKRAEFPVYRMALGIADGAQQAGARHEATKGVQLISQAHELVRSLRAQL